MNYHRQLVIVFVCCFALVLFAIAWIHLSVGQTVGSHLNLLKPNKSNSTTSLRLLHAFSLDHPPIHAISINSIHNDSISISLQLKTQLDLAGLLSGGTQSNLISWFIHRSPNSTIDLPQPIYLYNFLPNTNASSDPFAQISLSNPFKLPLSYHLRSARNQTLNTISHLNLLIRILSPHQLNTFIDQTIAHHACRLRVSIQELGVQLDADRFPPWLSNLIRSWSRFNLRGLESNLDLKRQYGHRDPYITMNLIYVLKIFEFLLVPHPEVPQLPPIFNRLSDLISIDDYSFYPIPAAGNTSSSLNEDEYVNLDNSSLIGIRASASIPNPVLQLWKYSKVVDANLSINWRIPLLIYRKNLDESSSNRTAGQADAHQPGGETLLATAFSIPFDLSNHQARLTIPIEGSLVPGLARLPHSGPLSDFLNEFLKGRPNNLTIRYHRPHIPDELTDDQKYGAPEPEEEEGAEPKNLMDSVDQQLIFAGTHRPYPIVKTTRLDLPLDDVELQQTPKFILEILSKNLNLNISFPGISNETNLIKAIQIKEMKINILSIIQREIRCSGKIEGVLNLPNQLRGLTNFINITQILPDVILLDGRLPNEYTNQTYLDSLADNAGQDEEGGGEEGEYPSNAFGRLDLPNFIPAKLIIVDDDDDKDGGGGGSGETRVELRSEFDQVRLKILEGRSSVFRKYATKYILHHRSNSQLLPSSNHLDHPLGLGMDQREGLGDDDQSGVLTSILGTFDGIGTLMDQFPLQLITIDISGSFFV